MVTKVTTKTKKLTTDQIIGNITNELLTLMGVTADVEVTEDKVNSIFIVSIKNTEAAGLLIGRHGETILSLQTVIALIAKNKTGEWLRIVVNVGDWREKEEEKFKSLAIMTAERAIATKEPQPLYNLTPGQRRIVHLELSEHPSVVTESQGEGTDRYLVVTLKNS